MDQHAESIDLTNLGDLSAAERTLAVADCRLQADFPGQYVAYVDEWKEEDKGKVLSRKVLASGKTVSAMEESLAACAETASIQKELRKIFVTDPSLGIEDRPAIGNVG